MLEKLLSRFESHSFERCTACFYLGTLATSITGSDVSLVEALMTIERLNYHGYVSFEWEKYWHPEIEEPEVALPDFINAIRKLQSDTTKSSCVNQ